MARTQRTEKQIQKDHTQLANEKAELFRKINEAEIKGQPFWCFTREQRIDGAVCKKVQSTAGCPAGADNCPLWDSKANLKAEQKPGEPKKNKSGKLSYQVIMKAYFLRVGSATLKELVDLINYHPSRKGVERQADNKNVSVGVSILKNPKRMKNPLTIDFSRKTKTYYCLDVKGMKKMLTQDESDYNKAKADHINNKPADTPDPDPTPESEEKLYKDMTLKELKVEAKILKVKIGKKTKPQLLTAVQRAKHIELEGGPQV